MKNNNKDLIGVNGINNNFNTCFINAPHQCFNY